MDCGTVCLRAELLGQPANARGRPRADGGDPFASGSVSTPVEAGGRYFYSRRDGDQDQPVVYVREGLDGEDRALLDPNAMSDDGTTTVDWYVPSKDGKLLAYGKSVEGTETSTMYILDLESGRELADVFPKVRFANPQWLQGWLGVLLLAPGGC